MFKFDLIHGAGGERASDSPDDATTRDLRYVLMAFKLGIGSVLEGPYIVSVIRLLSRKNRKIPWNQNSHEQSRRRR